MAEWSKQEAKTYIEEALQNFDTSITDDVGPINRERIQNIVSQLELTLEFLDSRDKRKFLTRIERFLNAIHARRRVISDPKLQYPHTRYVSLKDWLKKILSDIRSKL